MAAHLPAIVSVFQPPGERLSEKEVCLLCLPTSTPLASVISSDLPVTWILQNGPRGPGTIAQNGGEGPGQDQRSPS